MDWPFRIIMVGHMILLVFHLATAKPIASEFYHRDFVHPPHCTRTPIIFGHFSRRDDNGQFDRNELMQLSIGLHTTACFRMDAGHNLNTSSLLHTLTLRRLEHYHPVSQSYHFGIPEVKAECKCDCKESSDVCSAATHSYEPCMPKSNGEPALSCYRTFHASQSPIGCPSGQPSKLCCEVNFSPYRNWSFTAIKLEQPSTFAVFEYRSYDWRNGRWLLNDTNTIRMKLDGGTQTRSLDSLGIVELSVSAAGRASHQLETGMYYVRSNVGGEMEELRSQPLNENMENREDERGRFNVNNGVLKIKQAHHVKVQDCKNQRYRSLLDAKHYVSDGEERFALADTVERTHPWIQSARLIDGSRRHALVDHAEGTNLQITLSVAGDDRFSFVHNGSRLKDFSGTIIVDAHSNRFFNVTLFSASGFIIGSIKRTDDRASDEQLSFTVYVNELQPSNVSTIVPLPAMIAGGERAICLRPDDAPHEDSMCHVIPYHEIPLNVDLEKNSWSELVGSCPECNNISFGGFLRNLNPRNWFDGVTSISDFVMMASDMIFYLILLTLAYVFITKCLLPIMKCFICPVGTMWGKSKG